MIKDAEVVNFRIFSSADFELDSRVTAIVGANGAGKTSVLEALYLLGHGRSHRSADRRPLIRRDADFLRVVANVEAGVECSEARIGLELRRSGELVASVNRERVGRLARLLQLAPVMLIDGDVQAMFSLGSTHRRGLLDWGVFHVERPFGDTWREYQRALRQRNAALKIGSATQASMWDSLLNDLGERLHLLRSSYVSRLENEFIRGMQGLLATPATLSYRPGWTGTLADSLNEALSRDLRLGFTSVGPHRADLMPAVASAGASQLSRGQQKLLAIGLLLAQVHVHASVPEAPRASVLVDDAGADLDVDNLGKLYSALQILPAQLVVTAIDERALQRLNIGRMFHVEQGTIRLIP